MAASDHALDLSRWGEKPHGVGYRRWAIVSTSIRQLLATRFFKVLVYLAWFAGLLIALLGFAFSQSIAEGGWLESLARNFGPRAEALVTVLGGMVTLYPDIVVRGIFTLIFWLHSFVGLWLSLLALTVMVPHLVARDRASNALTIYLSRPLTSADYLLGKFGAIVVVLLLTWTGPLLFGWLVSMLLSSDRDFIMYSFSVLLRALMFNGIALAALAPIALGVSALTRSGPGTTVLWVALWIVAAGLAKNPAAPAWLKHSSFSHNLAEVRQQVFRVDEALSVAATDLPILSEDFKRSLTRQSARAQPTDYPGALKGLGVLVLISSAVFFRRLKAE